MQKISFIISMLILVSFNCQVLSYTFESELKKAVLNSEKLSIGNRDMRIIEKKIEREYLNYVPKFSVSLRAELFNKVNNATFYSWQYSYWKKTFNNEIDLDGIYNLTNIAKSVKEVELLENMNDKNILSYVFEYKPIELMPNSVQNSSLI